MSDPLLQTIIVCATVLLCVWSLCGTALYAVYKTGGNVSIEGEKGGAIKTGRCAE